MLKNHKLAKAISEVSWLQFRSMLNTKQNGMANKSLSYRKHLLPANYVLVVDIKIKRKNLNLRKWDCPSCRTHHDRDINASINLKNEAIRLLTTQLRG